MAKSPSKQKPNVKQAVNHPAQPYNNLQPLPPRVDLETKAILKRCVAARAELAELKVSVQLIPDETVLINAIPILEARASSEIENIVTTNDSLFREASLGHENQLGDPTAKEALRYRTALHQGFKALDRHPLTTRIAIEACRTITAIHPFGDGNGRTGRILNLLFLVQAGLLEKPTLYLSRHILRTRSEYYASLARVTQTGDWEAWIIYMLTAVEQTARWTNNKVRAVRDLMQEASTYVRAEKPRIYSRELIELLFTQPYCRIENLTELGLGNRVTASGYLKQLVAIGTVEEEKVWRDKVFINRKYLDLLSSDEHTFKPYADVQSLAPKVRSKCAPSHRSLLCRESLRK